MEFRSRTVIVTGAGQGIGRGIAQLFAQEGAAVVIAEINPDTGTEVAEHITRCGGRALFVQTNVAEQASVREMVRRTIQSFGTVDVLCNNAAVEVAKDFCALETEDWDLVLSVNLRSVYLCTREVIPHMMKAGGGSVVNISSVQAVATTGQVAAYAAAKGALLSLTRDLAQDFGKYNIRVNTVCPGCIDTPMQDRALARLPNPEEAMEALCRSIPIHRTGRPEEIAEAVLFLSSPRASYITGTSLVVDGGLLTQLPIPRG